MYETNPRPLDAPKLQYNPGEEAFISIDSSGELARCTIVLEFTTPWHVGQFYVMQVMDDEHPHFEVRDPLLMSPTKEGPLPIWNRRRT